MGLKTTTLGVGMWKAVLPGVIALVTLGLSLVSGEVIKRDSEQRQLAALARTTAPEQAVEATRPDQAAATPTRIGVSSSTVAPVALVIGNAAYPDAGVPLAQPVNNARALATALKEHGFEVELGENLSKVEMERALKAFADRVRPGSAALIFFSGYGLQAARQTYLIPVNAQIWTESDVRRAGVALEPTLSAIDAKGAGAKLVVLDASRRNPFERRFRSSSSGIAAIQGPDETLTISSASPGKAIDDHAGELSPLLAELTQQLRDAGQSAEEIFNHTRVAVSRTSGGEQVPWVSSSLMQDFVFGPPEPARTRQSAR
jgi:uncharacterized caspase-like protein